MVNNETKMTLINCIPLMYLLYYISGIFITYKIWLTTNEISIKDVFNIQKIICTSFIGLINSIISANFEKENYLYTMVYSRIFDKLKTLFTDNNVFETYKIYNKHIKIVNNKLILSNNTKEEMYINRLDSLKSCISKPKMYKISY